MVKKGIADASTAGKVRSARAGDGSERALTCTILLHPQVDRVGDTCLLPIAPLGREAAISRNEPLFSKPGRVIGSPIADPFVSRKPLRIVGLDDGSARVSSDSGGPPVTIGRESRRTIDIDARQLAAGAPLVLGDRVILWLHLTDSHVPESPDSLGMVGHSASLRRARAAILSVADLHVPVLVRGETGTGKELAARAIHDNSPRRKGPFIAVNMGALARDLAAAELFGAKKGAYTGAVRDREGLFEAARGGTLFLDEVGEAPSDVQAMLLRALETGDIVPVGGHAPVRTDVRLVAATDAHLEAQIEEGRFKAPLFHRLAGYEVFLPPLRDRREDIGRLFFHFAEVELRNIGDGRALRDRDPEAEAWMSADIALALVEAPWPGNIRQLRNVARRLVIGSRGQNHLTLDPRIAEDLAARVAPARAAAAAPEEVAIAGPRPRRKPADVTEDELIDALRASGGDLKGASDRLGIPRSSMYDVLDRFPKVRTAGRLRAEEIHEHYEACSGDLDEMARRLGVSRQALSRRLKELGKAPRH